MPFKVSTHYILLGAGIGLLLAFFGTLCLSFNEFGNFSFSSLASVQNNHYLLWILDTSPLWLGMLAWFVGFRQDELMEQNHELNKQLSVQEKNEENLYSQLDNILDNAANEILICRLPDFKIIQASGRTIQNLGYTLNDLVEMHLYELFEDLSQEQLETLIDPLLKGSLSPVKLSRFQRKKEGTSIQADFELTMGSPSSPGFLTAVAGNFSNQTVYREALQRERKKFFDILENLPIAFHLQAQDYSVPYGNKMFRERFGPPEIKPCYALMHNRTAPCEICQPFQVFTSKEEVTSVWNSPDGKTYLTVCTPYLDIDQKPLVMEMALDITEMEQAKETAIQALEKAQKANEAKSEFLTLMNHELRAPLNAFLGFSHLMTKNEGLIKEEHQQNLNQILGAGSNLLDVFNKVHDMIQKESGNISFVQETFQLDLIINELFQVVHPLATKRNVSLKFVGGDSPTLINSDEIRIKQLLLNLLSNAIQYNKKGGCVEIRLNKQGPDQIRIDIEDTGMGIQENRLTTIFDPPIQSDENPNRPEKGAGLGLPTTKSLIERLGGSIRVTSKFGKGSCFSIMLPVGSLKTMVS